MVSIGLDNTNSNMDRKSSLKSRILQENPKCFVAGCNCHLAPREMVKLDTKKSGFDCEDHQIYLYYFFKRRLKRKGILNKHVNSAALE